MAEILKEWLTERLQRQIVWRAEEFGNMMKNGHIIASVLLSYNVINEEKHYLIRSSNATVDIENNWKYLQEWLRELEITMTPTELSNLKEGKGTTLLRLFYQLFLHLDQLDRIDFIKRERKMVSNLVKKMDKRFKVDKIEEKEEPTVDFLSKPLLNEKHFIEWQRKKSEEVKETFDYLRHKYVKTLQNIEEKKTPCYYPTAKPKKLTAKDKKDMEIFSRKYPCKTKNYTYEELVEMENRASEESKALMGSEWAQNYMENLYTRMHKKADSEEFQKQMTNALSSAMWNQTITEEETNLDTELAKKVLKLSQFEKQMCTQIMETKQQARNMFQNRVRAENEFSNQRKQQFDQYLDNIKEQINSALDEIGFEKSRQNMLHKRLYAEKMKRKRQHYYEICYETMLSIVDYATRYAYYKKLIGDDIPEHYIHEWKMLYFKQQPIFEILEPTEDLLIEPALEEEVLPEVEEIIRLELDRQQSMNDGEFLEYHNYTGPWNLDHLLSNFDPESEERKFEYLGTRVLGHVVYTLLEMKYPYPPPRPPADLPQFTSKAILRNLPDRAITTAMQTLLDFRRIHVVRIEAAINYCLKQFRTEMVGCTDIELSFDKFLLAAQEEPEKELIRLMKSDDETMSKSLEPLPVIGAPPPNTKQTQTPKTIPEEEIVLSTAAELGKYAYQVLSGGDAMTDYLLAAMIVEYIKAQVDIKGFVIINYPNSYRTAQILEEVFSGRAPPGEETLEGKDEIYLEEAIANHRKAEKDEYKEIRKSMLVNNPHKRDIEQPFESFFTCYIQLKETEDILQELVVWDLTEENSELIERFYSVLGINYSMYYELIEKDFLAQICKYIIGDCLASVTSYSDILFGENVLSNLNFPSTTDKRTKSKILKPETAGGKSKDRLAGKSKTNQSGQSLSHSALNVVKDPSSADISQEDTMIAIEAEEADAEADIGDLAEEVIILAGEEDWDYGKIPFAQSIGTALATCWEEVEKIYLNDMKQLFFAIRLQMNSLALYVRFIKDKMTQIITLPSNKQDLVSQFQKDYNEFENDWRTVGVTKNEWHCRVKDLQSKLYHICDERKLHAEQKRHALIMDNWTMEELTAMANSYISCMQAEVNRSILTFQALHDFYFAQLKKLPPNDRLTSKELNKISYDLSDDADSSTTKKSGGEDKVFRQLRTAFLDLQLKNIQIDYSNNPFNIILDNNAKFALKVIKDINDSYRSLISREYTELAKLVSAPKKKEDVESEPSITSEDIFKANALKCIDEWTMGINGEMYRVSLRILALQYKCYKDMKLFNDIIYKTFRLVQNEINTYYLNEIESVDRLCKYLQLAVEDSRKIPETLILEHDTFIIDPNLLQFPPPAPPAEPLIGDYVSDMEFKVSQLERLKSQFKIVAPTGIALQQSFIYILQDFLIFGHETCDGSLVPELWKRLDPEQVPKLVFQMFGDTVYVDWRDFLIYCANLRFPSVGELLDLRHDLRCIDQDSTELIGRDEFIATELWFERDFDSQDPCEQLRKNLIKEFLFNLFETSQGKMNYSAFLLALCKSADPIEGFAAALSVAVGKKVCHSYEECSEIVCHLIKDKQYRDACRECALQCTNQLLDKVIANVIDTCVGTTIIELQFEPVVESKKGKKGKDKEKASASKLKKGDQVTVSQSARMSKENNLNVASKTKVRSAVEVRSTFICPPCQEDEVADEKPQEVVEEEQKVESPDEDPKIAYAVSQKVIWNVLEICLPWHFTLIPEEKATPYKNRVQEILKWLEHETDNGDIYVCHFLKEPDICKLMHKVKKFTALSLLEEVRKIIM
ncbi:sperm flagellar protein 2-like [Leguminivora glycinivorella]|uniref:sperm flagellar protein 2-like n=1 Tax=Leguminivora glycinivorella TaxID=1035111 RepID=UPI00200D3377|nr:sperm flagellar protein 2-like [Leguminivora glycinivorella]